MHISKVTLCLLIGMGLTYISEPAWAEQVITDKQNLIKHENNKTTAPTEKITLPALGSIATKPIEHQSLAIFTIDSQGNSTITSPNLVLDRDQQILVQIKVTTGDSGYTTLKSTDGTQLDFPTSNRYTVSAGTWAHYANGTIWGQGQITSTIIYTRLIPDCSRLTHLSAVGWTSGHKNNHCIAHGYDGATNTSHGGNAYRKNGGGWCFSGKSNACQSVLNGGNARSSAVVEFINEVPIKKKDSPSRDDLK